jgi:hypothetical protein
LSPFVIRRDSPVGGPLAEPIESPRPPLAPVLPPPLVEGEMPVAAPGGKPVDVPHDPSATAHANAKASPARVLGRNSGSIRRNGVSGEDARNLLSVRVFWAREVSAVWSGVQWELLRRDFILMRRCAANGGPKFHAIPSARSDGER